MYDAELEREATPEREFVPVLDRTGLLVREQDALVDGVSVGDGTTMDAFRVNRAAPPKMPPVFSQRKCICWR